MSCQTDAGIDLLLGYACIFCCVNFYLVAFQTLFVCCGNKEYIQHLRRQRQQPYIYIIRVDLGVGSLNVMISFFPRSLYFLYLEKMKEKKNKDNFNFLLVGFWASAGKGRMNNHAEPKDKRAFFPLLESMLAEGEVIFVCVCVCTLYEEVKRWRWSWEVLGEARATSKRGRCSVTQTHTTAGGKKSYNSSNSLRTRGASEEEEEEKP